MSFKLLSINDKKEWTFYLNNLPAEQHDIYYTPEYYSLYENNGDGEAMCFVFKDKDQMALYPFLINSVNALGYKLDNQYYDIQGAYGYNGIVSSSQNKDFIKAFYRAFNAYCQDNNIIAEFTRFHPLLKNFNISEPFLKVIFDRKTVFIDLVKSEENLFSDLQNTTRKQIRRCINRYNLQIIQKTNDITFLSTFANIYNETMNRVGSNAYLKFNMDYFRDLFLSNKTIQFIAMFQNEPVGMITAIFDGKYMHGHLGGTLTEYLNLSVYSLLYWEMIKTAKKMGLNYLHVGGGVTSEDNDPLFVFKKHFSNNLSDFYIGKKIHNIDIYNKTVYQWIREYPKSYSLNKKKILGYREI